MARILCLEGIIGAGKTTQARMIKEFFSEKNISHLIINEKQYSPFKEVVLDWHRKGANQKFSESDILKFAKARAETHKKHFLPLLDNISYLIFDRSLYTSAVYQCSREFDYEKIIEINIREGAIKPEEGVVLICSTEIAIKRITNRRLQKTEYKLPSINETPEEIDKRKTIYIELVKKHPELYLIDTTNKTEWEVFEEIKYLLKF
jgi:dTMP kinase